VHLLKSKAVLTALAVSAGIGVAACGSSTKKSTSSTPSSAATTTPSVTVSSFTNNFSAMAALKPLATEGK